MFPLDDIGDRVGMLGLPVGVVIKSVIPVVDSNVAVVGIRETRATSPKEVIEGSIRNRAIGVKIDDAEIEVKCNILRTAKWIGREYIGMDNDSVPRCIVNWVVRRSVSSTGAMCRTDIQLEMMLPRDFEKKKERENE